MPYNTQQRDPTGREVSNELLRKFRYFDNYRKQWDEKAIEWYQKYVGWREELEKDLKGKRSNLHIPRTYQQLDTIRSRLVTSFFKSRPYVDFIPEPEGGNPESLRVSEQKAEVASALVDMQLEKNSIYSIFYDYVTSLLIFPAGVLSVGWKYQQDYVRRKVPTPEIVMHPLYGPQYTGKYIPQIVENLETTWDDNEIQNVDFFDFWPDPDKTDIDKARGVFHREWVTEEELYQRLEWLRQLEEGTLYPVDWRKVGEAAGRLEKGNRARLTSIGISSDYPTIYGNTSDPQDQKNKDYELLHYWEDNRHAIIVNQTQVVYDGPSPYWRHRKKPFVMASYEPMPNEMYGMSAAQIIYHLQEEENTQHNQRLDNVNMVINRGWLKRRGADIDNSELVSHPRMVLEVPDIHNDIKALEMPDVPSSAYNEPGLISQIMENTLATPPIVRGAEGSHKSTATTDMLQNTNAGMRFEVKIRLYETLGVKRLFELMDMNNQQFIDEERLVKVGPDDAVQWRTIQPGELIGEFDYRPAGANIDPAANKEVRRDQLGQMIGQLMQYTQFMVSLGVPPQIDLQAIVEEWIKTFDIRNTEKFFMQNNQGMLPPQLMAMQGMGMPGQGPPPGNMPMGGPGPRAGQMPPNPQQGVMSNIARNQ